MNRIHQKFKMKMAATMSSQRKRKHSEKQDNTDINSMIGQNGPGNLASNGKMIFRGTVWKRIIEYAGEVDNDRT